MNKNLIGPLAGKKILFLQGPMGYFFKNMAQLFKKKGATVFHLGLSVGDAFFADKEMYVPYRGTRENWQEFIKEFLDTHAIEKVFVFGDCRFYQKQMIQVARALNIEVFVFEEGYVRPYYLTLERCGVNDHSLIPRDRAFFDALDLSQFVIEEPTKVHFSQTKMILSAMFYYFLGNFFAFRYPSYKHHRDFSASKEAFYGIRNFVRKYQYRFTEKNALADFIGQFSGQYFFIPLQTHNDFQILEHSGFPSVEQFIIEVLSSFSEHGLSENRLLFKHHPVDRGRKNYVHFIREQAALFGVLERVHVLHDVHLPTCLKYAKGTVTVNSTVGLSSILHKTPTLALGKAIYDIEGLTNKGVTLKDFWHQQISPDMVLFEKFQHYLIYTTQLNGSFYGKMPEFE